MWGGAWGIPPIDYKTVPADPRVVAEFEEGRKVADAMIADPEGTLKRMWARLLGEPMDIGNGFAIKEIGMALYSVQRFGKNKCLATFDYGKKS